MNVLTMIVVAVALGAMGAVCWAAINRIAEAHEAEGKRVREWWLFTKAHEADLFNRALSNTWGEYAQLSEVRRPVYEDLAQYAAVQDSEGEALDPQNDEELRRQLEGMLDGNQLAEDWTGPTVG